MSDDYSEDEIDAHVMTEEEAIEALRAGPRISDFLYRDDPPHSRWEAFVRRLKLFSRRILP